MNDKDFLENFEETFEDKFFRDDCINFLKCNVQSYNFSPVAYDDVTRKLIADFLSSGLENFSCEEPLHQMFPNFRLKTQIKWCHLTNCDIPIKPSFVRVSFSGYNNECDKYEDADFYYDEGYQEYARYDPFERDFMVINNKYLSNIDRTIKDLGIKK